MNDFARWVEKHLDVPYLDVSIDVDEPDFQPLLDEVAPGVDKSKLYHKRMTDGITNVVLKCQVDVPLDDHTLSSPFLIRIYGSATEMFIDRKQEMLNHKRLHAIGRAQPIFAVLKNGYAYGYCPGRPASLSDFSSPAISSHIAKSLGEIHRRVHVPAHEKPRMFSQIRSWLDNVPESYSTAEKTARLRKHVDMASLRKTLAHLEDVVCARDPETCFCHNDLLCHNVIIAHDSKGTDVQFIDYEYGGVNYCAYDIANHFNEFAGLDVETIDYSRCPGEDFRRQWVTAYLHARDDDATETHVNRLLKDISIFTHVSHLYWGAWALVQAAVSEIDFDYLSYALVRLDQVPPVIQDTAIKG
ncbi:hypothetical protein PTSG_12075 [Salpingoeca rosetta]|uniref:ethanolamine kinase n=1 Tax=Salpingoeca rosetta (strain ATCC 50818 / BSB-021) TaxID=946362 RepID=F2U6H5_SALR5|nr:uncharacterized protein PTSG_12075 [Salpingoeca rosetta]EGD83116.1 hypothetical protein PTSG_12075 [Salpingoeca rosetta]|eukprot:XP_004995480.1 hypothetical protein PTSG_12075 [Salpingoeca rosetta]